MLRISKMTDYATVILARLAAGAGAAIYRRAARRIRPASGAAHRQQGTQAAAAPRPRSAPRAACTAATAWHVSAGEITAAQILDALEGPMALIECAQSRPPLQHREHLRGGPGLAARQPGACGASLRGHHPGRTGGPGRGEPVRFAALERQLRGCAPGAAMSGNSELSALFDRGYQHGFVTDIESDTVAPGLDESVVRLISAKKREPQFLLDWRLRALRALAAPCVEPHWAHLRYTPIDFNAISYFSAPKAQGQRAEEPGRGGPEAAGNLRQAGRAAARAGAPRGRGRGRGL